MRILQVTPAFPPSAHGGISTHVGQLSMGLAERGHDVSVLTTNRYDSRRVMPISGWQRVNNVQVFYAKAHWPGRYFFAPSVLGVLRASRSRFDVMHVHDTRTFVGLAAYRFGRQPTLPYVVTCHGSLNPQVGSTWLKIIHDYIAGKGLVDEASRIIALSEREKSDILEFGISEERITIIPNAIPLATPMETPLKDSAATHPRRIGRTVLYLGRIHPIKGIERLIDAFAVVNRRYKDSHLLVVGQDYGAQRFLQRKTKTLSLVGNVRFPGPMYGPEKDQLLQSADVLVVPSYRETFPLVILEAFAAGLAVIVTDGCGISKELELDQAALVVSSTDEMARAIEECFVNPNLVARLRASGLRLLQTKYDWNRVLSEIEQIYQEV